MVESIILKNKGAKWYVTDDYASPNLSKSSLGEFFFTVLSTGAQIGEIWPFNYKYARSLVVVSIYCTEEQKIEIETKTRYRLKPPTKISLPYRRTDV